MPRRPLVLLLLTAALTACDEGPLDSGPSLRILAGADVTDTIDATPTQGLVVEVRGEGGKPLAGADVRFETPSNGRMWVSPVAGEGWTRVAGAVTDAQGRAVVRVRMSALAGDGRIAVSVPLYDFADTARYTILPGKPVRVALVPRDTALTIGMGFTYRGTVVDRMGNARSDPATFELEGNAITLSNAGVANALAVGVAKVRVRASIGGAAGLDSGTVAVVPTATIAWGSFSSSLSVSNLAGGELRTISSPGLAPSWEPGGNRFVATNSGLIIVNADNSVVSLPTPGYESSTWPEWSSDGFIYFVGNTSMGRRVGRVRPDGTGLEMLPTGDFADMPSPSPDATRVAYIEGAVLKILSLQARSSTTVTGTGGAQAPRWSPDGHWIAFTRNAGELWVVRPNGMDARRIGPHILSPGITWSPDSRWILGAGYRTTLVDMTTGLMTQLTYNRIYPAWKR